MIIESIVGLAAAVLGAYIWERQIRDRVSVRRVMSADDADVELLLDLYQTLFPDDGTNYTADEFLQFIDGSTEFSNDRHVRAENIMLVAKYHRDVVGFVLACYYPERRKGIVGYYGINKDVLEARRCAGERLLPKLISILRRTSSRLAIFSFSTSRELTLRHRKRKRANGKLARCGSNKVRDVSALRPISYNSRMPVQRSP